MGRCWGGGKYRQQKRGGSSGPVLLGGEGNNATGGKPCKESDGSNNKGGGKDIYPESQAIRRAVWKKDKRGRRGVRKGVVLGNKKDSSGRIALQGE